MATVMGEEQIWLPIPFVTLLAALVLAVRVFTGGFGPFQSRLCFGLLFCLIALQAALVGIRFGYGIDAVAPLQRVLPFGTGPLAYLGFRTLTGPAGALSRRDLVWHVTPMLAAALLSLAFLFAYIDLLIALSFAIYIGRLVALYRRGPDALEAVGLTQIRTVRGCLIGAIVFLAVIAAADLAIAASFSLFGGRHAVAMISGVSVIAIAGLLAALTLYPRLATAAGRGEGTRRPDENAQSDKAVLETLERLMLDQKLYRDADVTLSRLGRRMGIPARSISEAVNRRLGMNVSQYVNTHRVRHAADLLTRTDRSVADVMLDAGFRTKSNFNREFRRITGRTPAEHRRAGPAPDSADEFA